MELCIQIWGSSIRFTYINWHRWCSSRMYWLRLHKKGWYRWYCTHRLSGTNRWNSKSGKIWFCTNTENHPYPNFWKWGEIVVLCFISWPLGRLWEWLFYSIPFPNVFFALLWNNYTPVYTPLFLASVIFFLRK